MKIPIVPGLTDDEARRVAIANHGRSLLVEAGAGSGKTAVMASRVAMMLAEGIAPASIAAVTFTEIAAAELLARVRDVVGALLGGAVPTELGVCLPNGLSAVQRERLATAAAAIDELACATIHGFCQRLIKPYPVEANIDPGARVADRNEADLVFGETVDAWLRERLSQNDESLLSELVIEDVEAAMDVVDTVLEQMRKHRNLTGRATGALKPPLDAYRVAVADFHGFVTQGPVREPESIEVAGHFRAHLDALADVGPLDRPAGLVRLLAAPPDAALLTNGKFRAFRRKGKWEAAAKGVGVSKIEAGLMHDGAVTRYDACGAAWKGLCGAASAAALARLIDELQPAINRFQAHKRATGLLDFDDLLFSARDLLRNHDDVRRALGRRYSRVLVDEFQDTDPLQAEIFWRLCGDFLPGADPGYWRAYAIRPGALFLVGDPKQAIYRFRGADVAAYLSAREAFVAVEAKREISTNFRSRPRVLAYVNERFAAALSAAGQPGFTALDPFHSDLEGPCGVMALDVDLGPLDVKPSVDARRDAEAETVAEMCARLIGSFELFDHKTGVKRPCRPGDIALLAPTGTSLWRYEAALEERGVPVSTQAGKGFFRRQEVQDLIAVTRVLADGRDTLALGALLRGPLIGLSEEQLLDIVWSLPRPGDSPESLPPLNLAMPTEAIQDTYAREMVEKLQALRKLGNSTTPHALLSQAVDLLRVRSMLVRRHRGQAERALANLDLYLSLCRAYSTRGLRAFAEAMAEAWSAARDEGGKTIEGRADVQEEAVALYTMHASKGLEWPIVVPINTMGRPMTGGQAVVDRAEGCIYAQILGVEPDGYEAARAAEDAEIARERVRLWYVATTRARELLVLPRPSVPAAANAWSNLVDLALDALPSLDLTNLPETFEGAAGAAVNSQDRVAFAAEAAAIAAAQRKLVWRAPSRDEGPRETAVGGPAILLPRENEEAPVGELEKSVQGGRERGLVIHKLFEEVLNGETDDDLARLTARAAQLITELGRTAARDPAAGLVAAEMAGCVVRSLAVPDIAVLLPSLAAELPVYSSVSDGEAETATAGVVDAASVDQDGKLVAVVDWKSDVAPDSGVIDRYREQVLSYLDATGAAFGLIVFVTTGIVVKVAAPRQGTL